MFYLETYLKPKTYLVLIPSMPTLHIITSSPRYSDKSLLVPLVPNEILKKCYHRRQIHKLARKRRNILTPADVLLGLQAVFQECLLAEM